MLSERGTCVDHSTICHWVPRYAPAMEKRLRWYWKRPSFSRGWQVDETYIKVKEAWTYLYRGRHIERARIYALMTVIWGA